MAVVYTLFLLLETSSKWMFRFARRHNPDIKIKCDGKFPDQDCGKEVRKDIKAKNVYEKAVNLTGPNDALFITSGGLFKDLQSLGYNLLTKAQKNTNAYDFKVQMLMNQKTKVGKPIELFKEIKNFRNVISDWVTDWDDSIKKEFFEFFHEKAQELKSLAKNLKESIADVMQGVLDTLTNADDVIFFTCYTWWYDEYNCW